MSASLDEGPAVGFDEGPAAGFRTEVSCRMGYTEHHVIFALLYLVCFLNVTQRVAWPLRGLIGGCAILNVLFHALLGGVCSSRTISSMVHHHLAAFPLVHNYTGHNYIGHRYIGHDYIGP